MSDLIREIHGELNALQIARFKILSGHVTQGQKSFAEPFINQ